MNPAGNPNLNTSLAHALGSDASALAWPRDLTLIETIPAVLDPQNELLTIYGGSPDEFGASGRLCLPPLGSSTPGVFSRLLVLAASGQAAGWQAVGFRPEGQIAGYWADGTAAELWGITWGRRGEAPGRPALANPSVAQATSLAAGWQCHPATVADATAIRDLLGAVFHGYQIPADPGVIRYALASGAVHGRVIRDDCGHLQAYASLEFQPGDGAVEITDCATAVAVRSRGLMTHLVGRLQEDLDDVFDGRGAYALAREDQPGMQKVFAGLGWQCTGRLVNHFRVGGQWLSANVWCRNSVGL